MNKIDFLILSILLSNNADGKLRSMSVSDILAEENLKYKNNTIYKQLKEFSNQGLVGMGAKDGKAITFYITTLGKQILKEEKDDEE